MKRFITLMLAMVMALSLAACGSKDTASVDAAGLAKALAERVSFDSTMTALSADDLGFYIELPDKCTMGAYMSDGSTMEEIFVVACESKTDADAVKVSIQALLDSQKQEAERYQAEEAARLDNAVTDTANAVIKEYVG